MGHLVYFAAANPPGGVYLNFAWGYFAPLVGFQSLTPCIVFLHLMLIHFALGRHFL